MYYFGIFFGSLHIKIFLGKRRFNIKLWKTFTDCFNCLPISAIIDEKIFCCHGGLSPDLQGMEQIRRIMRPTDVPDTGTVDQICLVVCVFFLILFLFFFPKGSCATYYGQIRTKTSKDGGRTIAVFRSRSEPTSSANFWIAMIWTWFAERIRSSKMVTNFSLKDNWSLYSRLRTIAGNSTTQGGWWVSTRHSCALFR